jgi:hypothetical protein
MPERIEIGSVGMQAAYLLSRRKPYGLWQGQTKQYSKTTRRFIEASEWEWTCGHTCFWVNKYSALFACQP